jgi:protein O-mannosyl-transferase
MSFLLPLRFGNSFSPRRRAAFDVLLLALAIAAACWPVLGNGFVNWDDPTVLVDNAELAGSHRIQWAFTTTLIGHYQPLSWLAWAVVRSSFGLAAGAFHALSLAGHVANGVLVYFVTRELARRATAAGDRARRRTAIDAELAGLAAALLFVVHPLRVEAVAWASAYPYVLSATFLLLALLAYVKGRRMLALAGYVASLLSRASALGFPVVLLGLDIWPLRRTAEHNGLGRANSPRDRSSRATPIARLIVEKIPFAVAAAAAAAAEWRARDLASLQEIGVGARLSMAASAPFVYLWHTIWPVRLSPLDALALTPSLDTARLILGAIGLAAVTALGWTARRSWPIVAVTWLAFLALLAPSLGLAPSGLQATADRYVYVPGLALSMAAGAAVALSWPSGRRAGIALVACTLVVAGLAWRSHVQSTYWHDSIALWSRAATLDPSNDVATYNLAIALAAEGRDEEAVAQYEQTLRLVPDHALARRNLAILQAAHAERDADRLAQIGRTGEAGDLYARALALDANRLHSRAARGVLLARSGRFGEASTELRSALAGGVKDPEVANALAFALVQTGEAAEAVAVLKRAVAERPDDVNLKHNLARLLATAPDARVRDGALALSLASEVCAQGGNDDPRALDTLAAAYAAVGRLDLARDTAVRAVTRARELADPQMAEEIAAHARSYRRR